ncbi:cytochrome-c oxidase, cbb3-type subunit III [Loktanella sp. IMCC34160]|uniref:cytochrome-c oxidase, cbb3-type subunit III n=1 Tax=Loktanella sp. IMCC34160 TaxID=2510646 RepID=UPI00101C11B8|nr:cytochrome-c oxidase, cbb3-type subunit III [Loktanella sp. IMCC34160]RYG89975.1 cytochrome-c oxidase, cbb3-type subunit III [Loktanella sp. IMCC34160]
MTIDPKALPGVDPHTGSREVDPVTGYDTTGHDWSGIRELNTPFPKVALIALAITVAYSVIAWVLLPAWPLGRGYTRGLLGLDQGEMAVERLDLIDSRRGEWLAQFEDPDFGQITADEVLMARVRPAADRLFQDNCAACHGAAGLGGPGFPVLADDHWLWGGDPETTVETLQVGINATHPDTRWAQMPAFDWMARSDRRALAEYVAELPSGQADHESPAAVLFDENCVVCHGDGGGGGLMSGAPSLTDNAVIYGQSEASVMDTLRNGRQGVMPHWSDRLTDAQINLLAVYVSGFGIDAEEGDP